MANKAEIALAGELERFLDEQNCDTVFSVDVRRNNIRIDIEGDWKHSLLYCDHLVELFMGRENNPVEDIRTMSVGETDCDWGRTIRVYRLAHCVA